MSASEAARIFAALDRIQHDIGDVKRDIGSLDHRVRNVEHAAGEGAQRLARAGTIFT